MNRLQANVCLIVVTLIWSFEVVLFSVIPDEVSPWAITCVTSLIGTLLLGACFGKRIVSSFRADGPLLVRRVAFLSALNATYSAFIIMCLSYFDVSTGAFTLSFTMVVLPAVMLVMRRRVSVRTWVSALLVLAGVLAAFIPTFTASQVPGLAWMLAGCTLRAAFIVKVNGFAREHDPVALSGGMIACNAVVSFVPWFVMQPATFATLPVTPQVSAALFIYAYFSVAFVTVLNIFAQRRATPAEATIIFSTEIVFSVLWAAILPATVIDPVPVTLPTGVGCVLIVLGSLVEILRPDSREAVEAQRPAERDGAAAPGEKAAGRRSPGSGAAAAIDTVGAVLTSIRPRAMRSVALFGVLLGVYLVLSLPFKVLVLIPGFTDIRPVCMLQPVYGIFFGIPGCLASAVGNLISDVASGSLRWSSIAGFVGNFAYPYLMYLIWTRLSKKEFRLRTGRMLAAFCASAVFCAAVQSLIISPVVALVYPDVDIVLFAASVVANSTLFPICFAVPFIILVQEELGFSPCSRGVVPFIDARRAA